MDDKTLLYIISIMLAVAGFIIQFFLMVIIWFGRKTLERIERKQDIHHDKFHDIANDLSTCFYRDTELEKIVQDKYPEEKLTLGPLRPTLAVKPK